MDGIKRGLKRHVERRKVKWIGLLTLREMTWALSDMTRDGRKSCLARRYVERRKVKWITLAMCWEADGELDCLWCALRNGRWNGFLWRCVEIWVVKWIGLGMRWERAGEMICLGNKVRVDRWNGLACWFVERWKVKWIGLEITLRDGRWNGMAEEGSAWRVFVLGVSNVVGCAGTRKPI